MTLSLPAVLLCLALAGCFVADPLPSAPSGGGRDTTGDPSVLTDLQRTVFTPYCVGCHSPNNASGGLDMSAGNSYGNIVGIPATGSRDMVRVEPGDTARSYLYLTLTGSGGAPVMPPEPLSPLTEDKTGTVGAWIDAGASRDLRVSASEGE